MNPLAIQKTEPVSYIFIDMTGLELVSYRFIDIPIAWNRTSELAIVDPNDKSIERII